MTSIREILDQFEDVVHNSGPDDKAKKVAISAIEGLVLSIIGEDEPEHDIDMSRADDQTYTENLERNQLRAEQRDRLRDTSKD